MWLQWWFSLDLNNREVANEVEVGGITKVVIVETDLMKLKEMQFGMHVFDEVLNENQD